MQVRAHQVMDSTRAERKTPRELSVKRNVRGGGQAAQTKLENSGRAIFSAIWSSSQETIFSTLIERVNALQATHDANPGAKAGPVRTAQIDSLTVRIETQFFERFEASVRGTPGLLLVTIPGDLTDGQRALLSYLASHAPAPLSGFAALGHVKDGKRPPVPRLPNGEYDFAKIQCYKCQSFGRFGNKCPRPTSSSAKTTSSEEATLQILQEMKAEMQSLRASMRDEAMAAAAAHYALGIPLSAPGPLRSAEDSDDE